MDSKKIMPIFIVMIMVGALIGIQATSAASSRITISNSNNEEVTSFYTTSHDEPLTIQARLYVNGEWRACRCLYFDVYDPKGKGLLHIKRLTSFVDGYTAIGIWGNVLSRWEPGDYTVKVSYPGNDGKGWPPTSATAVIHHKK